MIKIFLSFILLSGVAFGSVGTMVSGPTVLTACTNSVATGGVLESSLVGSSPVMENLREQIALVAPLHVNVLIRGETGTGKDLVAKDIWRFSARNQNNLVLRNCAALSESILESELFGHEKGAFTGAVTATDGIFQIADKGTVFLDELGEMPRTLQTKLLIVLQNGEFQRVGGTQTLKSDFRLIAATNANLEKMMREDRFRRDLYYRVNVFEIRVPPLREHKEDIPEIIKKSLPEWARSHKISNKPIHADTMKVLMEYHWPGNIRQLQNVLIGSLVLASQSVSVLPKHLPPLTDDSPESDSSEHPMTQDEFQRHHLVLWLKNTGGSVESAAKKMGVSPKTAYNWITKYDIRASEYEN